MLNMLEILDVYDVLEEEAIEKAKKQAEQKPK